MWIEIIRWVSIVLMWVATGINLYAFAFNMRNARKMHELRNIYIEALKDLTKTEE